MTGVSAGFNDTSPAAQAMHQASIEQASQPASSGPSRSTTEFPPIQELDDDDSDSDDDHSFGTASGNPPVGHAPATMLTEATTAHHNNDTSLAGSSTDIPAAQPSVAELDEDSTREQPPPLEAQRSPPTYNDAIPTSPEGHRDTNEFPKEYTGLLPSREPLTSPISEPIQQTPQTIVTSVDGRSPGGLPSSSYSISGSNAQEKPFPGTNGLPHLESIGQHTETSTTAQAPVDDFDADFDDLDEAQVEEDEHTQDSFVGNGTRGAEFDSAFDSPRSAHIGTTSFGSSTQFPPTTSAPSNNYGASTSATTYQPSFMPWMNNSTASVPATSALNFGGGSMISTASASETPKSQTPAPRTYGPQPPPRQGAPAQSSSSNTDWDSMFSGFDNAPTAKAAAQPLSQPKASSYRFDDDDEITSAPVQPLARTTTNSSIKSAVRSPPPPSSYRPPQQRPAPVGRALTTTGEHDDPFLKNLTGMGFERGAALGALEKFDYDIDRVRK